MDRHHQRAFGHLPLRGNVHVDGQDFFELAPAPPAGAEAFIAADHDQTAAHIVNVGGEIFLLIFRNPARPARDVGENHRVVVLQIDDAVGELIDGRARLVERDPLPGERIAKNLRLIGRHVGDAEHLPLAAHEGEAGGGVVVGERVAGDDFFRAVRIFDGDVVGIEIRDELMHAGSAQGRNENMLDIQAGLERHHAHWLDAGLFRIKIH